MVRTEAQPLRHYVDRGAADRFFFDRAAQVRVADLARGTSLGGRLAELAGRSVLIATSSQLTSALALIELDGVARRITILPPDVDRAHLRALIADAEIDAVVVDDEAHRTALSILPSASFARRTSRRSRKACPPRFAPNGCCSPRARPVCPRWWCTALPVSPRRSRRGPSNEPMIWGTFYDIRRYGGLQIFLRAVLGGASLILSSAGEPVADHLARLARHGVTHLSGTPSHWRRALMSPEIGKIAPRYVRLSGEIADQAILDNLRAAFPQASDRPCLCLDRSRRRLCGQ